jgi:hypothetical protein
MVPSGLVGSVLIVSLKPVTSATSSASSRMEMSAPVPTLIWLSIGLDVTDKAGEVGSIGQVTIMQFEVGVASVGIRIKVTKSKCVEGRRATFDAVYFATFF